MTRPTPTYMLLDHLLPGGVDEWVTKRRADRRSWRLIAREIYETTGVDITHETVRNWFPDEEVA